MTYNFFEKVQLIHPNRRFSYNGFVSISMKLKPKDMLIGKFIVPLGKKRREQLFKRTLKLIKQKKAILNDGYILSPTNKIIKATAKVKKQFQEGGFEILNGIAKRKRINSSNESNKKPKLEINQKRALEIDEGEPNKRNKLDEDLDNYFELFELVDVEFVITYRTEYDDGLTYHRTKGFLRNVNKLFLQQAVDKMTSEYIIKNNMYPTFVESQMIKSKPVPDHPIDLMNERMFGIALNYNFLPIEANSSTNGECVYDFLLSKYSPTLKTLTKEKLLKIFDEKDTSTGVSTYQIIRFCKKYNVSLYGLDLELQTFYHYKPEKPSHRNALVYVVANKHLYPIIEESVRCSIFASEREKNSTSVSRYINKSVKNNFNDNPVIINPEFEEISTLENQNVVFTQMETLLELVLYFYQTELTIYKTESYNSIIKKIRYKNGVVIYLNEDFEAVLTMTKELSIPFKCQSRIQLINEVFQIFTRGDKVHSTFNSESRKVFFDYTKGPFVFNNYIPSDDANLLAVDISKCYTNSISYGNDEEWCIYSSFDEVTEYKGRLKAGFYYIETDSFFPLKGCGWYSCSILKYCQSVGIEFTIKYELLPSYTLPANYFVELIERIYNKCGTDQAKFLINSMIGCWYRKTAKSQKVRYSKNLSDAVRYYFQSEDSNYFNHEVEGCEDLYEVLINKSESIHENLIPFYFQTIDNSNMAIHKLYMKLGGHLVSVKTDCVTVEDPVRTVEFGKEIGSYRQESIKHIERITPSPNLSYRYELSNRDWTHNDSPEMLLTGMAGSGKSFKMKHSLKDMGNYALTATTNRTARLIGGKTIHSLLGLRDDGSYDKDQVLKVARCYDYIVIDEIGLMDECLFEIVYYMKKHSDVKFMLLGDESQHLPIENDKYRKQRQKKQQKYFESIVMKELVEYNNVTLTENKRSDRKMWDLFHRIDDIKPSEFGSQFTKRHITKTNTKRIHVNQKMMDLEIKKKKKLPLLIEKNEFDKNSQVVRLLPTFPVMAIKTNKKLGILNGDTFVVSKLKPLTIKDTLTGIKLVITDEIFKLHFYINFASTSYRCQGDTINVSYTIHEWSKMSKRAKYVCLSRTTSKGLINIIDETDDVVDIPDTNQAKVTRNIYNRARLEDPLEIKRDEAHRILMKIVEKDVSDEFAIKHTLKTRSELLEYLGLPSDGKLPKNYSIDHIKERKTCVDESDFTSINYYANLRLMPAIDNLSRNWMK